MQLQASCLEHFGSQEVVAVHGCTQSVRPSFHVGDRNQCKSADEVDMVFAQLLHDDNERDQPILENTFSHTSHLNVARLPLLTLACVRWSTSSWTSFNGFVNGKCSVEAHTDDK